MGLIGHKSESAVRSCTKKLSEKKTRQMSSVLSSIVRSTTTEAIDDQQGTIATNNVSNAAAGLQRASSPGYTWLFIWWLWAGRRSE